MQVLAPIILPLFRFSLMVLDVLESTSPKCPVHASLDSHHTFFALRFVNRPNSCLTQALHHSASLPGRSSMSFYPHQMSILLKPPTPTYLSTSTSLQLLCYLGHYFIVDTTCVPTSSEAVWLSSFCPSLGGLQFPLGLLSNARPGSTRPLLHYGQEIRAIPSPHCLCRPLEMLKVEAPSPRIWLLNPFLNNVLSILPSTYKPEVLEDPERSALGNGRNVSRLQCAF